MKDKEVAQHVNHLLRIVGRYLYFKDVPGEEHNAREELIEGLNDNAENFIEVCRPKRQEHKRRSLKEIKKWFIDILKSYKEEECPYTDKCVVKKSQRARISSEELKQVERLRKSFKSEKSNIKKPSQEEIQATAKASLKRLERTINRSTK